MEGQDRIRAYIDRAFRGIDQSPKVLEAKEALCADLTERYRALVAQGRLPEAAYQETIASVGDIFELVDSMVEDDGCAGRTSACGGEEKFAGGDCGFVKDGAAANKNASGDKNAARSKNAGTFPITPLVVGGVLLLCWIFSGFVHVGPKERELLPVAFVVAAVGACAVWFCFRDDAAVSSAGRKKSVGVVGLIWILAGVLFVLCLTTPRFHRFVWLVPVAAVFLHLLWMVWLSRRGGGN